MSRAKSFNDFSYGVGLEYNASSYKQVKDQLKGNLDNLKQLADAYNKMIKVDPTTDLSNVIKEFKEVKQFVDQIKNSGNPFSEFVDKGVLSRVATLEQNMQGLIQTSSELKDLLQSTFGDIKTTGAAKFSNSFDKMFSNKAGEIQAVSDQIKALEAELKKLERLSVKTPDDLLLSGKSVGKNTAIKTVQKWVEEWENLLQRWNNLDFDGEKGQLQLLNSMQDVASKIYKALEIPKIDDALSKSLDTTKLSDSLRNNIVDVIDVTINDIKNKRESLQKELEGLQELQKKYASQNARSSIVKSDFDKLDYQAQVNITPKVTPSEWASIINSKLKDVEDKLDHIVLKPTFSNSSKNLEKDLQGNIAAINHTVKVDLKVEENLDSFNEKIKYIDQSLANAKEQIAKNAKFTIGFEWADGQKFKDVAYPVINQFKNIPVTLKLTNGKSFMSAINNLRKGVDEKLKNIGSTLDEEKITAKLKDIPITLKVDNKDALLAEVDEIRSAIDAKVKNIGINLQIANLPEFMMQAMMFSNIVDAFNKQVFTNNTNIPVSDAVGDVEKLADETSEANKKYQELNTTIQKTKTILDALSSKESLLTDNSKTSYFTKIGEWDKETNSFKKNTVDMEQLLEKYRELHELNKKANVKNSNDPHIKEELSLRGQINSILKQQKQHVAEILAKQEEELASVKNVVDTYNQIPGDGIKVDVEESKKKIDELNNSLQQTKDALASLNSDKFSSKLFGAFDEKGNFLSGDVKEKVSKLVAEYNNLLPVNEQLEKILQNQINYSSKRVKDLEKELSLQKNVTTEAYKVAKAYADTLNLSAKQKEHWANSMVEKALGNAFGTRADQGNKFYFTKFGSGDQLLQSFIDEAKVYDEILQKIGYRLGELKPNIGSDGGQWGFNAEAIAIPEKAIQSYDEAKNILMGVGDSATQTNPKIEELNKKLSAAKEALASLQKNGTKSDWFEKLGNIDGEGNKQQQSLSDLIAKSEQLKGTESQLEEIRQNQLKYLNEQKAAIEAQIAVEKKSTTNTNAENQDKTNTEQQLNKEKDVTQKLNDALGNEHVNAMQKAIASEEEKRKKSVELTDQLAKELEVLQELNKLGAGKKGSSGGAKNVDTSAASARIAKEYSQLEKAALDYIIDPSIVDKAVVSMKPLKDGIVEVSGVVKDSSDVWKSYTMQIKDSGEIDKYKIGSNQSLIKSYLERGKAAEQAAKAESSQNQSASVQKAQKQLEAIEMLSKRIAEYQNISGFNWQGGNLQSYFDNLKNIKIELQNALNVDPSQQDDGYNARLENLVQKAKDASSKIQKELSKSISGDNLAASISDLNEYFKDIKITGNTEEKFSQMSQAVRDYANSVEGSTVKINGFDAANSKLNFSITDADGTVRQFTMSLNDLTGAVTVQERNVKNVGSAWGQFKASIPKTFGNIFRAAIGGTGIYKFVSIIKEGITAVKDLDAAMTELKKVTDETDATYEKFVKTASQSAKEIGSTLTEFVNATSDFARLGYSIDEASQLAEVASIYTNIGDDVDSIDDATESIISTMRAFGIEAENSMDIINKFNEVGNNFAISSGGIGEALQNSASALHEAGNTIDESVALITAANSVVQNPSSVGTALKTLSLRLRGAKVELEEAGLETDNMADSVSELREKLLALTGQRVDIMLDDKTFKNSTQILREMSAIWDEMSDINRAAALELMGGKRQANILSAIISNFDMVEDVIKTSLDSENSALAENEKYLQSIQGRLDQFNNAKETMFANFISDDLIKSVVDFGTKFIEFLDKIGIGWTSLLGIMGGALTTTLFKGLNIWFNDAEGKISIVNALSKSFGNLKGGITAVSTALKGLVVAHPYITAIAVALAAVTAVTVQLKKAEEEAAQLAKEHAYELKKENKSLKEYKEKIIDLRYELEYGNLTEDEAYEVRKQLMSIQDELIEKYGKEAEGINLVTGAVQNQIDAIDDLSVANAREWLTENNKSTGWFGFGDSAITQAKEAAELLHRAYFDYGNSLTKGAFKDSYKENWEEEYNKWRSDWVKFIESLGGTVTSGDAIYFDDVTRDQVEDYVDQITAYLQEYVASTGNKLDLGGLIGKISAEGTRIVGDDYETHKANLEAYLENTAITAYTKEYSAILDAQEEFEEAYAAGNYDAAQQASKKLEDAVEVAKDATKDPLQINWFESLDDEYQAAVSEINFRKAFEENTDNIADGLKTSIQNASKKLGYKLTDIELSHMGDLVDTITGEDGTLAFDWGDYDEEFLPEQKVAYEMVAQAAHDYGMEVNDLIALLVTLGVVQGDAFSTGEETKIKAKAKSFSELTESIEKYNEVQEISSEIIADGTEISEEYFNSIKEYIDDEEALADCIDTTNGYIVTNADELDRLINKTRKSNVEQAKLARTQARLKYYELYKELKKLTGINQDYANSNRYQSMSIIEKLSLLEKEISKYSLLEHQLLGTVDAYNKLEAAQALDEENDYGSKAEEMVNVLANAFNTAELGTEAAQVAIAGLIPDEVIDKSKTLDEQMEQIYKYFTTGTLSKLFTIEFDDDGGISSVEMTKDNIKKFIESNIGEEGSSSVFYGSWDEFFLNPEIASLDEFAEKLGITKEVAFGFLTSLEKYDISWLGGDHETLLEALVVTQDDIDKCKEDMQKKFDQSNVDLTVRPKISSSVMQEKGYDVPDGDYSTVHSITYEASELGMEGEWAINVTPIVNGEKVLTEKELKDELKSWLQSGNNAEDFYLSLGVYANTDEAVEAAEELHEAQEKYYSLQENYSIENDMYKTMQEAAEAYSKWLETGDNQYWDSYEKANQELDKLTDTAQKNFQEWSKVNEEYSDAEAELRNLSSRYSEIATRIDQLNKKKLEGTITEEEKAELKSYEEKLTDLTEQIEIAKKRVQELALEKAGLNEPTEMEVTVVLDNVNEQIEKFKEQHKNFDIEADVTFNENTQEYTVNADVNISDEDKEKIEGLLNLQHGLGLYIEEGDISTDVDILSESADNLVTAINSLIDALNKKFPDSVKTDEHDSNEGSYIPSTNDNVSDSGVDATSGAILIPFVDPSEKFKKAADSANLYGDALERANIVYELLVEDSEKNQFAGRDLYGNLEEMLSLLSELTFNAEQFDDVSKTAELKFKVQNLRDLLRDNSYDEDTIKGIFDTLSKEVANSNFARNVIQELSKTNVPIEQTMATLDSLGIAYRTFKDETSGETRIRVDDSDLTLLLTLLGYSDGQIKKIKEKWEKDGLFISSEFDSQGVDDARTSLDNIDGDSAQVTITAKDEASGPIQRAIDKLKEFFGLKSSGGKDSGGGGGSGGFVNGTAHVHGIAHASGDWGLKKSEHNALVGELGKELVVDPNTGRWYTVGDYGAEMVNLPKDSIIFNHKQTESLLSKGYVIGRGKAYASGNAHVGINTFDDHAGSVYNDYSNAANSLSDAADNLDSTADDIGDAAEDVVDFIEIKLEEIEAIISKTSARLELLKDDISQTKQKDKMYDQLVNSEKNKADTYLQAAEAYNARAAELLKKVPSEFRAMAKNGAIKITDFINVEDSEGNVIKDNVAIADAINEYREWATKADDAETGYYEALQQQTAYRLEQLNDIADDYDNLINVINVESTLLQSEMDLVEESGGRLSENHYDRLIELKEQEKKQKEKEKKDLQKILDDAVKAGEIEIGSDEWYEAINTIGAIDDEIVQCDIDIEKFNNSAQQIKWDNLDRLIDRFDALDAELTHLYDRFTDDDKVVDDEGNWTDEGIAALGMLAQQMEVAQTKSEQYGKAIEDLKKDYKAGKYSTDEYNEKLAELTESQWDSIEAYEEAKDKIVDLNKTRINAVKDGMQKEIDAYKKLIDKKKESLDADKEAYDFEKNIQEQTKNISTLERKLAALQGDTSMSAAAQRKEIEAELLEAKEKLDETYYEHSIDQQKDALDDEYEYYEEHMNQEMEALDEYLTNSDQVILDSMNTLKGNADIVLQEINEISKRYGIEISDSISNPWRDGSNAVAGYQDSFKNLSDSFSEELDKIIAQEKQLQKQADKTAKALAKTVEQKVDAYADEDSYDPPKTSNSDKALNPITPSTSDTAKETTKAAPAKGDTVTVKKTATNFSRDGGNGTKMASFVPGGTFKVYQVSGNEVLIGRDDLPGKYTGWVYQKDLVGYKSGTTGVKDDEWAWIDEIGDELVLHAGKGGRLEYLTKGTSVIPADITSKLMNLVLDPTQTLENSRPVISAPHVTNNEITIDASIGEVIHIDSVSNDTLPNLEKVVEKQMDKYVKNLNNQIRKYSR